MKPIHSSLIIHFGAGAFLLALTVILNPNVEKKKLVEFRVIEAVNKPLKKTTVMPLKSAPIAKPSAPKKQIKKKKTAGKRKVFGVTKKSLRSSDSTAIKAKAGNTIAKKVDQKRLKKGMMNHFLFQKKITWLRPCQELSRSLGSLTQKRRRKKVLRVKLFLKFSLIMKDGLERPRLLMAQPRTK